MADKHDDTLKKNETYSLISADKVEGTAVYNPSREQVGTIDKIMIDKLSGKVAYAVMASGGFLGIGEKYHPLPWAALQYDTSVEGYLVGMDKKALEGSPSYERSKLDAMDWNDKALGRTVHDYYKVPPYV